MYLNEGTLIAQRTDEQRTATRDVERRRRQPRQHIHGLEQRAVDVSQGDADGRRSSFSGSTARGSRSARSVRSTNYGNVDISPKGDRAAVDMFTNNNRDIWVVDLQRSVAQPVIFDPVTDWTASWSPDGSRLAFASTRAVNDGATKIYEKSSTGAGTETMLPSGDVSSIPVHWSPDGKYIVFSRLRQAGNTSSYDTWLLPLFGDRKPTPLLETGFDKFQARVSPNSRSDRLLHERIGDLSDRRADVSRRERREVADQRERRLRAEVAPRRPRTVLPRPRRQADVGIDRRSAVQRRPSRGTVPDAARGESGAARHETAATMWLPTAAS